MLIIAILCGADGAEAESCPGDSVSTGSATGNMTILAILGRAWNQEFIARDTLVSAITVWRGRAAPADTALQCWDLFITEVETTAVGVRPVIEPVLFVTWGYFIPRTYGSEPLEVRWDFDPPIPLPHQGAFSFAIKDHYCDYRVSALADSTNPYPNGVLWKSFANNDCSGLGQATMRMPDAWDLIFEVEFCNLRVPARNGTWGSVKAMYR